MKRISLVLLLVALLCTGCATDDPTGENAPSFEASTGTDEGVESSFGASSPKEESDGKQTPSKDGGEKMEYICISQEDAKRIMEGDEPYILLDVREEYEYAQGHIPGAILIPHEQIASRAESVLPDKDALILVYCRSGRRSKIAAETLAGLGYSNVKEFGGIVDWPYDIVT